MYQQEVSPPYMLTQNHNQPHLLMQASPQHYQYEFEQPKKFKQMNDTYFIKKFKHYSMDQSYNDIAMNSMDNRSPLSNSSKSPRKRRSRSPKSWKPVI